MYLLGDCQAGFRFVKYKGMLTEEDLKIIRESVYKHLPKEKYKAFIFGSRADGTAGKWSDIDIGVIGDKGVPAGLLVEIEEELENSDIPYRVDVVDFSDVSEKFRRIARKKVLEL